jgi:predicted nuclease of predicted toxin-antitoxin system
MDKESETLKFIVDEDLPRSTTRLLREMGFNTLDVRDCGLRGKSDEDKKIRANALKNSFIPFPERIFLKK